MQLLLRLTLHSTEARVSLIFIENLSVLALNKRPVRRLLALLAQYPAVAGSASL
jgi:hypothetical protein